MMTGVVLLALAAAGIPDTRKQEPQEEPRPVVLERKTKPPKLTTRIGLETAYDDNILRLKKKQMDQLESGTRPEKFRIDEPDDFIYSPWVEFELKLWLGSEPTEFAVRIQPYYYGQNSFANYEEYSFLLAQDFGRDELGVEFTLEQDVYHRELEIKVPGPNLWESGFYSEHESVLYYDARFGDPLSVRGFGGSRFRDFDSPFDHRDRMGFFAGIRPSVEITRDWTADVKYEYADLEADADPTLADTSYRHHEIEARTEVSLLDRRVRLGLRHRWAFRDYTTGNDPLVDPDHVDREDVRQRVIVEARGKLGKGWFLEVRYERRVLESDRPFNTGDTAEAVGYRQQVFVVGVSLRL